MCKHRRKWFDKCSCPCDLTGIMLLLYRPLKGSRDIASFVRLWICLIVCFYLKLKACSHSDRIILVKEPLGPLWIPFCRSAVGNLFPHCALGLWHAWPLFSFTHTNKPASLNASKLWVKISARFTETCFLSYFSPTKFSLNVDLPTPLQLSFSAGVRCHTLPHHRQCVKHNDYCCQGKKKLTSGFCSRFPFERSFEKTLNAATVWHTEHRLDLIQEDKDTHMHKPFYWMTQISVIPPGLCGVFIHCFSACANSLFIGTKPQTSTCAGSGGELDYNSTAHYSAFTTTLSLATI